MHETPHDTVEDVARDMAGELFNLIEWFESQAKKRDLIKDSRYRRVCALLTRWNEIQTAKMNRTAIDVV